MNSHDTILIIDSDQSNIALLQKFLGNYYNILTASNGEAALKILMGTSGIDLVITEVVLPGMDGFEIFKSIKSIPGTRNIPVIFITSRSSQEDEIKGLEMGASDYIIKPFNQNVVSIKIKECLQNKKYKDHLEGIIKQRTYELVSSRDAVIFAMSLVAEGRDKETGQHIKRMQRFTSIIACKLLEVYPDYITKDEVERITLVAPLHDVGKVYIPDSILLKAGPLTPEEFDKMKNHTIYGANVLRETVELMHSTTDIFNTAIEIAESHHEKYDGSGYPYGLKGKEIPISARITALADVYDALISKRVYKEAFPREKVAEIILEGDGRTMPSHFDPKILRIFSMVLKIL